MHADVLCATKDLLRIFIGMVSRRENHYMAVPPRIILLTYISALRERWAWV